MKNNNQLLNLYKGISTCQSRINKGLEGKSLIYAKRYIKGAKTKISKILKNFKNSSNSDIINKVNKEMKIYKKVKEVANKVVKAIKTVMDKLMDKNLKNSEESIKIKGVDKKMEKNKKMALPNDFMIKLWNVDFDLNLDDEEIFENEIDLADKYSEWYE